MLRRLLVWEFAIHVGSLRTGQRLTAVPAMESKPIRERARHVGLDFYDPFIEGHYTPSEKSARNPFGINEP